MSDKPTKITLTTEQVERFKRITGEVVFSEETAKQNADDMRLAQIRLLACGREYLPEIIGGKYSYRCRDDVGYSHSKTDGTSGGQKTYTGWMCESNLDSYKDVVCNKISK